MEEDSSTSDTGFAPANTVSRPHDGLNNLMNELQAGLPRAERGAFEAEAAKAAFSPKNRGFLRTSVSIKEAAGRRFGQYGFGRLDSMLEGSDAGSRTPEVRLLDKRSLPYHKTVMPSVCRLAAACSWLWSESGTILLYAKSCLCHPLKAQATSLTEAALRPAGIYEDVHFHVSLCSFTALWTLIPLLVSQASPSSTRPSDFVTPQGQSKV